MTETLESKAARYVALLSAERELAISKHELETDILIDMEADGASVYANGSVRLEVTRKVEYDQVELGRLDELMPPNETAQYKTPEKTVVTPPKWSGSKLRPLLKLGGEVRAIIEASRREGPARLRVRMPKETT